MSKATATKTVDESMWKRKSRLAEVWHRLKKNKVAVFCMFLIVAIILVALLAKYIAPYPYDLQDYSNIYAKPSAEHLFGTDGLGRDVFSRIVWGARQSLMIGLIATAIASIVGITIGSIAGYFGGWIDLLLMRFLDIYQSIPMFLLCVTLSAVLGPSIINATIAIGIAMVPGPSRMMRASILSIRENEYIDAARSINASNAHIILKHIIPNAIAPLIVYITMNIGMNILMGASLSFLGLGAQPPIPEWGCMVSDARSIMRDHGVLAIYPGVCIMLVVLAFNLVGDGLRDALDPRLKS